MRALTLLAAAAVGLFLYPMVHEGAASPCAGLAARLARLQAAPRPAPAELAAAMHAALPAVPDQAGCAAAYWISLVRPDMAGLLPILAPAAPRPR
ncbi:MAG: hypothetical protein KGJ41_04565 [Rhodospirillales bacterium]|nr:hypothetical protein [Rhodospirillales bacterium]MDE2574181.1 hypothetical protein [Rhodospirillales bacterium]